MRLGDVCVCVCVPVCESVLADLNSFARGKKVGQEIERGERERQRERERERQIPWPFVHLFSICSGFKPAFCMNPSCQPTKTLTH